METWVSCRETDALFWLGGQGAHYQVVEEILLSDPQRTADQMWKVGIMTGLQLNGPQECKQCSGGVAV